MNHAETTPQPFQDTTDWPREEFGRVQFGDKRLKRRLFRMAERAAAEPSGRITDVLREPAERQAGYDFVSNPRVDVVEILSSMASATVKRAQEEPFMFVPVDGTSLTLTDSAMSKGFGPIGGRNEKVRGIKVVSAIGVDPAGIPLGLMAMTYWVRNGKPTVSKRMRKVEEKELKYWLATFDQTLEHLKENGSSTRAWFQVDREDDAWPYLQRLSTNGHLFTVRGSWDRRVRTPDRKQQYLRDVLAARKPLGMYSLRIAEGPGRSARVAHMSVYATTVTLDLRDQRTLKHFPA